jgi:FAD/FMN-containing dehydrogenase
VSTSYMSDLGQRIHADDWQALEDSVAGEVVLPGAPSYEEARRPPIARFHDIRPQAVVRCATPADVAETLALAQRAGVPTAARSGGHCFAGRSSTDGVVIDVSPMNAVTVGDGVARIGAGARLGAIYDTLDEHRVTIPAGCGTEVGIAGLTLGGGLGILGRRHGLLCDSLAAATIVVADGRTITCSEDEHADLFWALRGAGNGRFGVVTELVFQTLAPPPATAFRLVWPHADATELALAWQEWAPEAPGEIAASLLITAPPEPEGPPIATVFGAMLASERETEATLAGLVDRAGTGPAETELTHGSYRAAKRHLAGQGGAEHGHIYTRSEFFARPLPPETVAKLVGHIAQDRVAGQARELDFSPWGGAYNRTAADATAFPHRDARFLLKHAAVIDPRTDAEPARRWVTDAWATVHPHGTGGVYPNFPDPELDDPDRAYFLANLERVRRIEEECGAPPT